MRGVSQMVHDRVVERLVALLFADLDHARNLVRLAFADEVRDRRIDDQNLERGDAARLVDALEKVLRDDAFERFRESRANLVLLVGGKTSMMRSTVLAALEVCSVPKTRWPVAAAVSASSMVSRSRISPTSRMSGSSRSAPRKAEAKEWVCTPTSR